MGLTARQVSTISKSGRHGDGAGLYLNVTKTGAKSWVQRIVVDGRRRDIGLGGYPAVSLARARELCRENRTAVADGRNPLAERRETPQVCPTFREAALAVHQLNAARFRSEKHTRNWIQGLEKYVFPTLGDLPLDRIDRRHVLSVVQPLWTVRHDTARRLRQRIRGVFAWGQAHGWVDTNPAGESIDAALPAMPQVSQHFRALPYAQLPAALGIIRGSESGLAAKLALEFVALTAARSGEVRDATWGEIDWERKLWIIPASRMKTGDEHRQPLSRPALEVLREAWLLREEGDCIFPSPVRRGRGLSDMTLTKVLRSNGLAERTTVHGLRSSFRNWASEATGTPWAVAELALSHRVGTAVERAYHRTDLLEARRELMENWGEFLAG